MTTCHSDTLSGRFIEYSSSVTDAYRGLRNMVMAHRATAYLR